MAQRPRNLYRVTKRWRSDLERCPYCKGWFPHAGIEIHKKRCADASHIERLYYRKWGRWPLYCPKCKRRIR